ncbi:hypothetical protein EJB05_44944, partial [Eragrostis curvula]
MVLAWSNSALLTQGAQDWSWGARHNRRTSLIRGQGIDWKMRFSREEFVGSAFIAFGITLFVGFFYAAIVSKLLPPYENRFLAAIQNDW